MVCLILTLLKLIILAALKDFNDKMVVWCKNMLSMSKKEKQKKKVMKVEGNKTDILPSMMCFLLRPLSVSALREHKTQKDRFKKCSIQKKNMHYIKLSKNDADHQTCETRFFV